MKYILNTVDAIAWLFILPFIAFLTAVVNFPSTCVNGTNKYIIKPE